MSSPKPKPQTKAAKVEHMLGRTKGVSVDEMCIATSWKPHSVRALLSGVRKKGFLLVREQLSDKTIGYRIARCPENANTEAAA